MSVASVRRPRPVVLLPLVAALVALGCVAAPRGPDLRRAAPAAPAPSAGSVPTGGTPRQTAPAGDPTGDPPGAATPATPQAAPSTTVPADGTGTLVEFQDDVSAAVRITEAYWRERFTASGREFEPVRDVITYRYAGEEYCGAQPSVPRNALYCPADDTIMYDEPWSYREYARIGDAFVFYLLGHEYAHAVQARLGVQTRYTIDKELQADCLAGAVIGDSVRARRLALQSGDLDELREALASVADAPGQPWYDAQAHGSARQRTEAFERGVARSLDGCALR